MQQISTNMGGYQWWDQDSNGETKTKSKTLGRKTKTKTVTFKSKTKTLGRKTKTKTKAVTFKTKTKTVAFRTKTVQDSKVTNIQDPQGNTNVCIYRSHN